MERTRGKKWLSFAAAGLALCLAFALWPLPASARELGEVQEEIDAKKDQLGALEEKITASQGNKEAAEAAVAEYQQSYDGLVALIEEQAALLADTEGRLDAKTGELSATLQSLQDNRDLYEKRLVAIYKMNNSSALGQALNVDSFSEFMQALDALQRISERDTALLAQLDEEKQALEMQKLEIEENVAQLTEEMQVLQANRDWAAAKVSEMRHLILLAEAEIAQSEEESEATEAEIAQLQAEYENIFRAQASKGSSAGDGSVRYNGPLRWPVPGIGTISSYYGDPRSNTGWHYGIDIPGAEYTNICAAASGTVITAEWHWSYGNYIVVDHGGGLRTLYAHCIELYVGVGSYVTTGDVIAGMGNTGNSFGSHLHFEVHDGGGRQNPLGSGYLSV